MNIHLIQAKNKKLVRQLQSASMAAEEKIELTVGEVFFIQEFLEIGRIQTFILIKNEEGWYYYTVLDKLLSPLWGQGDSIYCYDDEGGESVRLCLTLK